MFLPGSGYMVMRFPEELIHTAALEPVCAISYPINSVQLTKPSGGMH